jgi:hypothetical protein
MSLGVDEISWQSCRKAKRKANCYVGINNIDKPHGRTRETIKGIEETVVGGPGNFLTSSLSNTML